MPDTGNVKDCLELPPTNFSIFTLKNVTWRTNLISFPAEYCFLPGGGLPYETDGDARRLV